MPSQPISTTLILMPYSLLFVVSQVAPPCMYQPFSNFYHYKIKCTIDDLKETGWIHVAQDRDLWKALMNMAMNLWVP
jgi:hypothetical protein